MDGTLEADVTGHYESCEENRVHQGGDNVLEVLPSREETRCLEAPLDADRSEPDEPEHAAVEDPFIADGGGEGDTDGKEAEEGEREEMVLLQNLQPR